MKIYIIAGEASGDLHASNLMHAMNARDTQIEWRGWGGDLMRNAGMDLVKHYKDTAVMGLINVLLKLRSIKQNMDLCKADIKQWAPDLILFVDYPGFNLRIAEYTKQLGIPNYYYIAPKVWASREKRVEKIKKYIDKVFAILPFEKAYFSKQGIDVEYVGNPVADALDKRLCKDEQKASFLKRHELGEPPIIALLCGSRLHEVTQILPYFLELSKKYPQFQYVIAGVSILGNDVYERLTLDYDVKVIFDDTYALLQQSHAALVASGTATLETALMNVPQVVCYRLWGKYITQVIMRFVVKAPFISLVNLILNKEVVKELIQRDLTAAKLDHYFQEVALSEKGRATMFKAYATLNQILGGVGASEKAADRILSAISESGS